MNKKTTDIVAYLSWVGLIVAYIMGDRNASRFHLNQALVISLVGTAVDIIDGLMWGFPLLDTLVSLAMAVVGVFCVVCWFIGIIGAIQGTEKSVPVLGEIHLLK